MAGKRGRVYLLRVFDYLVLDLNGGPVQQKAALASTLLSQGNNRLPVLSGNFQGTLV